MNRNGFDIGEYVSYGINGMCSIEDIRPMRVVSERRGDDVLYPAAGVQSEIDDICSGKQSEARVEDAGSDDEG